MSIYLSNKYLKIYYNLVKRSFDRTPPKTYEKHHIIPKALGGTDNSKNLAYLTPREHFIAHLLLLKITEGSNKCKMAFAVNRMRNTTDKYKITSRQYETIRIEFCEAMRLNFSGKNNPMYGKLGPMVKPIIFNDIHFPSKKELYEYAKENYNLSSFVMKKYLKDKNVTTFKQCLEILDRNNSISKKAGEANKGRIAHNKGKPNPYKGMPVADRPIGWRTKKRQRALQSTGNCVTIENNEKVLEKYNG